MEVEFLRENFFTTIDEAYGKMDEFVNDYNATRYHAVIKCTPHEKFNSIKDDSLDNLANMSIS